MDKGVKKGVSVSKVDILLDKYTYLGENKKYLRILLGVLILYFALYFILGDKLSLIIEFYMQLVVLAVWLFYIPIVRTVYLLVKSNTAHYMQYSSSKDKFYLKLPTYFTKKYTFSKDEVESVEGVIKGLSYDLKIKLKGNTKVIPVKLTIDGYMVLKDILSNTKFDLVPKVKERK